MPKTDNTAEGFIGSVAKYSVSTVANIAIMAIAMVLTSLFIPAEANSAIQIYITWTQTLMNLAILGLDQALIRFYYEPPKNLSQNGLFRLCFYFSSLVLLAAGIFGSTLLARPLYALIGFEAVGAAGIPLLFLNALFYLILRYFSVLYRMEANIKLYTVVTVGTQFFYRLFFIFGYFVPVKSPMVMMVAASLLGMGGLALVLLFAKRRTLAPRLAEARSGAYKTLLPYGVLIAPTGLLLSLNNSAALSLVKSLLGDGANGIYAYSLTLANMVSLVQLGFSAFWGAYMFEHYKTQQARIKQVHNYLNFVVLAFYCCLVAFEDVIFWLFPMYGATQPILPLMMLAAVFTVLCETTVYGNAIARRPIFDTLGWGVALVVNLVLIQVLVPLFGLYGAAAALCVANLAMYVLRTATGQHFYQSIESPLRTSLALALAAATAAAGTIFADNFPLKGLCCLAALVLYCLLYAGQLKGLWALGHSVLRSLFKRWQV